MYCVHSVLQKHGSVFRTMGKFDEEPEQDLIILDINDRKNYNIVYRKLSLYVRRCYRIMEGINIKIPKHHYKRIEGEMREEQQMIHIEPRADESISGLWDTIDDIRRLTYIVYKIKDPRLRKELMKELIYWETEILQKLHLS